MSATTEKVHQTKTSENQDTKSKKDDKIKPMEKTNVIKVDHIPQEDIQISWYHSLLIRILKTGKMPKSIGIIMDGNRRYATKLKKEKHKGHSDGLKNLENTVFWCKEMGITQLTVYALSKDNLKRPKVEVDTLMNLCKNQFNALSKPGGSLERNRIRIKILGDISLLPPDVQEVMVDSQERTKHYENGTLNVCLCYNSKHEIFDAMESLAHKHASG